MRVREGSGDLAALRVDHVEVAAGPDDQGGLRRMEGGRAAVTDVEHGDLAARQHLPELHRARLVRGRGQQRAVSREDQPVTLGSFG